MSPRTPDSDLNAKILNATDFLEKKNWPNLDAFKHMPMHTLNVKEKHIMFQQIQVQGTEIKMDAFEQMPKMSGRFLNSVGASEKNHSTLKVCVR